MSTTHTCLYLYSSERKYLWTSSWVLCGSFFSRTIIPKYFQGPTKIIINRHKNQVIFICYIDNIFLLMTRRKVFYLRLSLWVGMSVHMFDRWSPAGDNLNKLAEGTVACKDRQHFVSSGVEKSNHLRSKLTSFLQKKKTHFCHAILFLSLKHFYNCCHFFCVQLACFQVLFSSYCELSTKGRQCLLLHTHSGHVTLPCLNTVNKIHLFSKILIICPFIRLSHHLVCICWV